MSEDATPTIEKLQNHKPLLILCDLDQVLLIRHEGADLERRKSRLGEDVITADDFVTATRKVGILNRWQKFWNVCVIPSTQRPASFFLDSNGKYFPFTRLTWNLEGKESFCPFLLCEMGAVILRRQKDGDYKAEVGDDFKEFAQGHRDELMKLIKDQIFNASDGEEKIFDFEEGKMVEVSLELGSGAFKKYGGEGSEEEVKERAKNKISEILREDKRVAQLLEKYKLKIVTEGRDVDIVPDQGGKWVAVKTAEREFTTNPNLGDFQELGMMIVVDDKSFAISTAAEAVLKHGGGASAPANSDEDLQDLIISMGGSVSRFNYFLGSLSAIGQQIMKKRYDLRLAK